MISLILIVIKTAYIANMQPHALSKKIGDLFVKAHSIAMLLIQVAFALAVGTFLYLLHKHCANKFVSYYHFTRAITGRAYFHFFYQPAIYEIAAIILLPFITWFHVAKSQQGSWDN